MLGIILVKFCVGYVFLQVLHQKFAVVSDAVSELPELMEKLLKFSLLLTIGKIMAILNLRLIIIVRLSNYFVSSSFHFFFRLFHEMACWSWFRWKRLRIVNRAVRLRLEFFVISGKRSVNFQYLSVLFILAWHFKILTYLLFTLKIWILKFHLHWIS